MYFLKEAKDVAEIKLQNNHDDANGLRIRDLMAVDGDEHYVVCNTKNGCDLAKQIDSYREKIYKRKCFQKYWRF